MSYNKTIIQIGSFIGHTENDPIFNHIDYQTRVILIEPVPIYFNLLQSNYQKKYPNHPYLIFINKAITTYNGTIDLYVPSINNNFKEFPFFVPQLISINPNHIHNHQIRNPNINYDNLIIDKITVPTTTLNNIIDEYNITDLQLLNVDTEGHDYDILMNYNFKVKPNMIIFEHDHMDNIQYSQKNNTYYIDQFGPKYQNLKKKLESIDYFFIYANESDAFFYKKTNLSDYL